ncbi:OmpA family protein [Vibrio lentus]|uniref:OmpA family protein n=1 Tax=Vibrio lentus TaxID=136468 RepID=UPI002468758A|nr:OmpA family protein [Vibrio lentus]
MLLTSLFSMPMLASAEDLQFFLGAKGGYQWAQDDSYNHSDPNGAIWGIYSGVQFTPSWSWDVGYQYHDDLKADVTSVNVKTWLIESALRYDWYLRDNLSLYGRLGVAYWDMEKAQPSLDNLDATGFSPLGEVGAKYNLTPSLSLSAGYQYIDSIGKSNTGKYDSHAAMISLAYTFGRKVQSAPVVKSTPVPEKEIVNSHPQPQMWGFSEKSIEGVFGFDSIKPSDSFVQSLGEVSAVLKAHPQARANIVGHTDSIGTETYNQALSERRAQAVAVQLVDSGVTQEQLESRGEGESNPIADNATAEGRAQNRRVEITIPNIQFEEQAE